MGALLICPAGPAEAVERIRPYAEAVSRKVIELPGEPCKNATLLKVVSNNVTGQYACPGNSICDPCGLLS